MERRNKYEKEKQYSRELSFSEELKIIFRETVGQTVEQVQAPTLNDKEDMLDMYMQKMSKYFEIKIQS